jgi:hypothetical protein
VVGGGSGAAGDAGIDGGDGDAGVPIAAQISRGHRPAQADPCAAKAGAPTVSAATSRSSPGSAPTWCGAPSDHGDAVRHRARDPDRERRGRALVLGNEMNLIPTGRARSWRAWSGRGGGGRGATHAFDDVPRHDETNSADWDGGPTQAAGVLWFPGPHFSNATITFVRPTTRWCRRPSWNRRSRS